MNRFTATLLAGVAVLGFASASQAADLIVDYEPVAPGIVASGGWDGAYVGVFAGYGWGTLTEETGEYAPAGTEFEQAGWQLGVRAGADFTVSEAIVAGIVADIAWADINDPDGGFDIDSSSVNWLGSVRGRLGFDGGMFLPYVTAGLAFANNTVTDTALDSDSQTHIGWTAGAGVEFAVADNMSFNLEYRYSDYGSKNYEISGADADFGLTSQAVTAGINFRF
jgi:outer membrane immunogenic protein